MSSESDVIESPIRGSIVKPDESDRFDMISNPQSSTDTGIDEDVSGSEGQRQPPVDEADMASAETVESDGDPEDEV